jgi:hypothetical protein
MLGKRNAFKRMLPAGARAGSSRVGAEKLNGGHLTN